MPEGPEVRKYADSLGEVLSGNVLTQFTARTSNARAWLEENREQLLGRRVDRVVSHGKHLIGYIDDGYYFHSHLMMWGRWQTFTPAPPAEVDRRERARIVVRSGAAILFSAPIFNLGHGDPYSQVEYLDTLGPDILPYDRQFDTREFRRRLGLREYRALTIGAALLNQQILAGIGNYLRAEILFVCQINPWRLVKDLKVEELICLEETIPKISYRAYSASATATEADRDRMRTDPALVYQPGREYGTRHFVFRRTNLPCLRCGETVKQKRQVTHSGDEDRERIVYFCPECQSVEEPPKMKVGMRKSQPSS